MNGDKPMKVTVKVFNKSRNELPSYATTGSAGIDLVANINGIDRQIIYPGKWALVHTGLYVAIPEGYELQIRPRSGLALKKGISVLNTPGTIDSDYRGEIGVIIVNYSDEAIAFANGDKIAQAVLKQVDQIEWESVSTFEQLPTTDRGEGGFGSTDKK
jgi:dUTP pyrophosphatase